MRWRRGSREVMARGDNSVGRTVASSVLVLLVLQTTFMWDNSLAVPVPVPAKKNDILAGTEFLSMIINGVMAPRPTRRRISLRRGNTISADNVAAESKNNEANIFRISRAPITIKPTPPRPRSTAVREEGMRYYPISHKLDNRHHSLETIVDDLGRPGDISSKFLKPGDSIRKLSHGKTTSNKVVKPINQKVIGISVTSTVEATPYKVRVEHHDPNNISMVTRPPPVMATTAYTTPTSIPVSSAFPQSKISTMTTHITSSPARLVTEELSNIVSESNRSEFSVDEGAPKTSSQVRSFVTANPTLRYSTESTDIHQDIRDSIVSSSNSEPVEQRYDFSIHNHELKEINHELSEVRGPLLRNQGRKVGRHFEESPYNLPTKIYNTRQNIKVYDTKTFGVPSKVYNEPSKVYGEPEKIYSEPARVYSEPAKVYGEPSKVYSEPSKVYSEPAKVYSEPAKVYSEPEKIYSEPARVYSEPAKVYSEPAKVYSETAKVYSEPAKVYSEPAKVYSEPAKVYGEPSKVYDRNGHPFGEPEEKNYEVDETVSVGSNGNVHGPQTFTETTNIDENGQKVGFVVEGRNYRKYRVEERTPDGFIVGEYGVVSHDDGSLRGVRYTADGTINPRLIYDALMKFLAL